METGTGPLKQNDAVPLARRRKAKRRLAVIVVIVILAGGAWWYFEKVFSLPLAEISSFGSSVASSTVADIRNFSAPSPIQMVTRALPKKTNALTIAGIIAQTNVQRAENGNLPSLAEDQTLDDIATLRIDNMFAGQYFAHVNPATGESAVTVASNVGYAYLAIGENLALGLYDGDAGVVNAWMNSPGHRANILDVHYTQIGVAVREGMFQGQETWIAVQVFGRPASDCPAPDATMKANIDLYQSQLAAMRATLSAEQSSIEAIQPQSGPAYNQQVGNYNILVAQYNVLAAELKTAIDDYNAQATAFNQCLAN